MDNETNNYFQNNNEENYNISSQQTIGKLERNTVSSQKTNKTPIFIIIGLTIIVIGGYFVITNFFNKAGNNNLNNQKSNYALKQQNYLNKNSTSNDKLSFIINHSDNNEKENNIFMGFTLKDILKQKDSNAPSYKNDLFELIKSNNKEVSFYYDKKYYNFNTVVRDFVTSNNQTVEKLDKQDILYKKNNFYVTTNNNNKQSLFYKYDEKIWDGFRDNEIHATWNLLSFGMYDTLEEAKEQIEKYNQILYICTYTDAETISKCNYKDYKYINDIVIDVLNYYDLYIDSYNQINIEREEITVNKNGTSVLIKLSKTTFKNLDGYKKFKLNNMDFYIKEDIVLHDNEQKQTHTYSHIFLNYKSEKTEENMINTFTDIFSKYILK